MTSSMKCLHSTPNVLMGTCPLNIHRAAKDVNGISSCFHKIIGEYNV